MCCFLLKEAPNITIHPSKNPTVLGILLKEGGAAGQTLEYNVTAQFEAEFNSICIAELHCDPCESADCSSFETEKPAALLEVIRSS